MELIKTLCILLDNITNPIILIVAMIELILMVVSIAIMAKLKYRIKKLNSKGSKKSGTYKKEEKGNVTKIIELESKKDWEEFDQFLEDYQEKGWWYSAFSLIIQIFTLLGILGTVAGLYLAMSNGQDMYEKEFQLNDENSILETYEWVLEVFESLKITLTPIEKE